MNSHNGVKESLTAVPISAWRAREGPSSRLKLKMVKTSRAATRATSFPARRRVASPTRRVLLPGRRCGRRCAPVLRTGKRCGLLDQLAEVILNDGDAPVDLSQSFVVCHLSHLRFSGSQRYRQAATLFNLRRIMSESARPLANTSNSIPAWRCFTISPPTQDRECSGDLVLLRGLNEKLKSCTGKPAGYCEHRRHKTVGVAAKQA